MGVIEDIGQYLDASSTRFALGTNLFLNFMPSSGPTCAALYETGGLAPERTFAPSTQAVWENARLQLMFRSTSSTKCRSDAAAAWNILDVVANRNLPTSTGSYYLRVAAMQSPFLLMRDDAGRIMFCFNVDVTHRL